MNISDALFYGLIQGVTEFIPVSSAAHLSILFNLFGVPATGFNVKAFSVFLHFGTIIAALISYLQDFGEVLFQTLEFAASGPGSGGPRRKNFPSARLLFMMVFSSLPLLMIMPLNMYINRLFDHSALAGIMLILTGVMLFVSDRMMDGTKNERNMSLSDAIITGVMLFVSDRMMDGTKNERNMSLSDAIIIGLCQMVSSIPGISRTGTVYTAGIAVGLKREFAAKYAVMLSVPVMFLATTISLPRSSLPELT